MPFLAMIGAMVSDPGCEQDKRLLSQVITSLDMAAQQSPGAAKLYEVCRRLYQSALGSIEARQTINSAPNISSKISASSAPGSLRQANSIANHNAFEQPISRDFGSGTNVAFAYDADTPQTLTLPDSANELLTWFEDYMGSNTSMLDILESDLTLSNWDMANL